MKTESAALSAAAEALGAAVGAGVFSDELGAELETPSARADELVAVVPEFSGVDLSQETTAAPRVRIVANFRPNWAYGSLGILGKWGWSGLLLWGLGRRALVAIRSPKC